MQRNADILNELKSIDSDLPIIPSPDFVIPGNYFDSLSDQLLSMIHETEFIDSLPKPTEVLPLPDGYFDGLAGVIMEKVKSEDFIKDLPQETPFTVPALYFENLTKQIVDKTIPARSITPLRLARTLYTRVAVAASLILILTLGFLLIVQKPATTFEQQLAQVSDSEILEYIQLHQSEFDNQVTYQALEESEVDFQGLENDIYSSYLNNVTDEELNDFL